MDFLLGLSTMQRPRTPSSPYSYGSYSQSSAYQSSTSSSRANEPSSAMSSPHHHRPSRRNSSSSVSRPSTLKLTEDNLRQLDNYSSSSSRRPRSRSNADKKKKGKDNETSSQATGHDVVPLYTDHHHHHHHHHELERSTSSRSKKHHRSNPATFASSSSSSPLSPHHGHRHHQHRSRELLLEGEMPCECEECYHPRESAKSPMLGRWRSEPPKQAPWYAGRGEAYKAMVMADLLVEEEEVMVERRR